MSFSIEITSVIDRDELVAEIWWKDEMFAEIHQDMEVKIEIYSRGLKNWEFNLDEFIHITKKAQNELMLSKKT